MKAIQERLPARLLLCAILVAVCTAFTAYYRSFARMAFFDDEGLLMLAVKRMLNGEVLYDQVSSIYGPFYYLYQWCAHALTGIPLSHDSVRFVTIAFWVAAALLVFFMVWRATGSLLASLIAHLLTFDALSFLGDAAHPQEACVFLLAALWLVGFARNRKLRMALLGALAGALVLTKINSGIFVIATLAVCFVFASRPGWLRSMAAIAVSCAAVLLPVKLMWGYGSAERYSALVALSMLAAIVTVARVKWSAPLTLRELAIAVLGFAAAVLAICWFPLSHGSSASAIFDWLVIRPRTSFAPSSFFPVPVRVAAPFWALTGLACAWFLGPNRERPQTIAVLKLLLATVVILLWATDRPGAILQFATPFLWLVVVRPGGPNPDNPGRVLLALGAVMESLYAFPVAGGSQISFASIPMIMIAIICLHDGLEWTVVAYPQRLPLGLLRSGMFAVGLLVALLYVRDCLSSRREYYSYEPLGLPGASRLRVWPKLGREYRALVQRVNDQGCTMLVEEPGLPSFNMWTDKPGPAALAGGWMLLDADEQQGFVRELSANPHACVIYNRPIVHFWTRGVDVSSKPLVRYIHDNFHAVFEVDDYRLMVR